MYKQNLYYSKDTYSKGFQVLYMHDDLQNVEEICLLPGLTIKITCAYARANCGRRLFETRLLLIYTTLKKTELL